MDRLTTIVTKVLAFLLISLMALMVIDVTWQIITRFVLKDPSSYTEELAGFLLVWIGLLGASYALYSRAHLGIDILTTGLEGRQRRAAEILIYVLVLLFALSVLVLGGLRLVNLTFTLDQVSPATGIRMAYVYLALPLSGILMMFYSMVFIIRAMRESMPPPVDR